MSTTFNHCSSEGVSQGHRVQWNRAQTEGSSPNRLRRNRLGHQKILQKREPQKGRTKSASNYFSDYWLTVVLLRYNIWLRIEKKAKAKSDSISSAAQFWGQTVWFLSHQFKGTCENLNFPIKTPKGPHLRNRARTKDHAQELRTKLKEVHTNKAWNLSSKGQND